jgi:hypothetical protein
MIAYILCEGSEDVQLLRTILPSPLLTEVEIAAAGGISSIKSLARSLIVRRQVPVAIVFDADSKVPELIQERIKDIEEIVECVSIDTPIKVLAFAPTMESIFFQDTHLLSELIGFNPSQDILNLALSQPKKALDELLSQSDKVSDRSQLIGQLTHENTENLQMNPVIQGLISFLQTVRKPATV